MPQAGFEPTIPVLERAKAVNVLDRAATVIGDNNIDLLQFVFSCFRAYTIAQRPILN
jgi:hypothetical protein